MAVESLAFLVQLLDEVVGRIGLFDAQVGEASKGVDVDEIFAGVLNAWCANDQPVDLILVGHLVLRRREDFILAEVPLWLATGLGKLALKDDFLILAFLGKLIDKRTREGIGFLSMKMLKSHSEKIFTMK